MYSISDTPRRVLHQHKLRALEWLLDRLQRMVFTGVRNLLKRYVEPTQYTSVDVAGECYSEWGIGWHQWGIMSPLYLVDAEFLFVFKPYSLKVHSVRPYPDNI